VEGSAVRELRHRARRNELLRNDSTQDSAHAGRLSGLQANSYASRGVENTVGGAVDGVFSQLPAVHRPYGGFRPTALILQPSVVQAGVVTINVAAVGLVSRSTGNCVSCWDFHRAGNNVSTVQLFGQYLAPSTFILGLDLALVVIGVLLLGLLSRGVPLVRGLHKGVLTLIATSLTAGILEFKALASISPMPRDGSSWADPVTVHLLMVNVMVLIISLLIGTYFARSSTGNLTPAMRELPDRSVPADQ
jgi:hypothetical protein